MHDASLHVLSPTSRSANGVPRNRSSLVASGHSLNSERKEPQTLRSRSALRLLLGIDQLMDMARTSVNVLGNCLATVVVSRWEGDFGKEQPSPVVMNAFTG